MIKNFVLQEISKLKEPYRKLEIEYDKGNKRIIAEFLSFNEVENNITVDTKDGFESIYIGDIIKIKAFE